MQDRKVDRQENTRRGGKMKYNGLRKTIRDRAIRRFAKRHPKWSQQEIARKFELSRSNITRILKVPVSSRPTGQGVN